MDSRKCIFCGGDFPYVVPLKCFQIFWCNLSQTDKQWLKFYSKGQFKEVSNYSFRSETI